MAIDIYNWWVYGKQPTHSNVSTRIQFGRQVQYDLDLHKIDTSFALRQCSKDTTTLRHRT